MDATAIPIPRRDVSHTEKGWKEDIPVNLRTVTEEPPAGTSSVILVRQDAVEELPSAVSREMKLGRTKDENASNGIMESVRYLIEITG